MAATVAELLPAQPDPAIDRRPIEVPASTKRVRSLDGLRGAAILLVLLYHLTYKQQEVGGLWHYLVVAGNLAWSGVDLFFVLSGFLIAGILLDAKNSANYYRVFYTRRFARIVPIYSILLGLYALRFLPFHWLPPAFGSFSGAHIPFWAYIVFTQNFWMAAIGNLGPGILAPTWSLAVEEQFYLAFPILIRNLTPRKLLPILSLAAVGVLLGRIFLLHYFAHATTACYVLLPCRADALLVGVLAAFAVRDPRIRSALRQHSLAAWAALPMFVCVILFACATQRLSPTLVSLRYSVFASLYVCLLLHAVVTPKGRLARIFSIHPLTALGTISYFVYLFHIPVIEAFRRLAFHSLHNLAAPQTAELAGFFSGVCVTLLLAKLSYRWLEGPLIAWGKSHKFQAPTALHDTAIAVLPPGTQ